MRKIIFRIFELISLSKLLLGSKRKNKRICCLKPINSRYNAYIALMKMALCQTNIEPFSMRYVNFSEFIWYHWIEKSYENPGVLSRIKKHAASGKKIIWNLHNKIPHETIDASKAKEFMKTMALIAHKIVIHCNETTKIIQEICGEDSAVLDKIVLVPHPNYIGIYGAEKMDNTLQNNKLSLCFLGAIKKYKNIELLISAITELDFDDVELNIIGRCRSKKYAQHLKGLIGENSKIKTEFRFVKDREIPLIAGNCHLFILPYNLDSSLNSGATILAFSYGRSVLSSETGTLADIKDKTMFFRYSYSNQRDHKEELKQQIIAIRNKYKGTYNKLLKLGEKCKEYVRENNSIAQVAEHLNEVFDARKE